MTTSTTTPRGTSARVPAGAALDGSDTVQGALAAADRLALGSTFA